MTQGDWVSSETQSVGRGKPLSTFKGQLNKGGLVKIYKVLLKGGEGAVLADENSGIVRLWALAEPFRDGRVMRALRRFFPHLEVRGEILRLGGFHSLAEAHHWLAEAKMTSCSATIKKLFRFDVPESLATIKHFA